MTAPTVRDFYNALQDRGLADSTIKYARALLNIVMRDARRRALAGEWVEHNLVFPSRRGTPHLRSALESRFRSLLKRAGMFVGFNLYSLRYTYATLQYAAGESDKVISELMGHTRTDFTKAVYTKVLPAMREQASDSLERLLFGTLRTTPAQSVVERVM